ncbi:MAG TPA: Mrp/NBP35 family ATP-binding protein [Acidimicrobiia bacterium]|nr:Mrp/NBP35 family ATP-binding protein [Acidimicrobiia bacterium]
MNQPQRPTSQDVERILEGVVDPELHGNIVELGMFRGAEIAGDGHVTVHIALTISSCPLRVEIRDEVASKVAGLPGVTGVSVEYSEMTGPERTELMQKVRWKARESAPETEVPLNTRIVAVASGKGGVGKSSVTVNLALALARQGHTVGILDADIWGFSVPRMLGVSGRLGGEAGKIHPNVVDVPAGGGEPGGTLKVISMGFLVEQEETALMWRGLMLTKAVEQFLTDVRWGDMDYLLVDMPPGTGDVQMALGRLLPRTEVLVVTTPNEAAQKVAARVADMARRSYLKIIGVVENMSAFVCDHGETYRLFGEGGGAQLAEALGTPVLGEVPLDPSVSQGADAGTPVVLSNPDGPAGVAFAAVAARVAEALPPIEMAGCTARMLDSVNAALDGDGDGDGDGSAGGSDRGTAVPEPTTR